MIGSNLLVKFYKILFLIRREILDYKYEDQESFYFLLSKKKRKSKLGEFLLKDGLCIQEFVIRDFFVLNKNIFMN